jgi:LysM repeat protein
MTKTKALLLLLIISLAKTISAETNTLKDYDFKGETNEELIAEIAERVFLLENETSELRRQIQTIKKEVFEKHGLYVVQSGDTYSKIAILNELELRELIDLNPDVDPRRLRIGMVLKVKK